MSATMNVSLAIFTLAAICSSICQADLKISDYIYWKKSDISMWHQFFPSRSLAGELLTNEVALKVVNSIPLGLGDGLSKVVAFQYRELETAKQIMSGTDAESCINGISSFLDRSISDQLKSYQDCTAGAHSRLSQLKSKLVNANATYQANYQRALAGIDSCARSYRNKDRLQSCVESINNNYFIEANKTHNSISPSPSMTYFQNTVVGCASDAAQAVAAKGSQFFKELENCSSAYLEELNQWKGYNDTLANQIIISQKYYYNQVFSVEKDMLFYYKTHNKVLEKYVMESRGLDFYLNKIHSFLSDYYNTVTATSLDNPEDSGCGADAKATLDDVAHSGAATSLVCDNVIVNDTKRIMDELYDDFIYFNNLMPSIGNVAVLNCISQGYFYAPNTIKDCCKFSTSSFTIEYLDKRDKNFQYFSTLTNYINNFYKTNDLPCGGTSLNKLMLGADKVLYELQRCLYKSSGTTFNVTTPTPSKPTTFEITTSVPYTTTDDYQSPENSDAYGDYQSPENSDAYGDYSSLENSEAYGDNQYPENSDAYGDYQSPENSDAYGDYSSLENSEAYGDNQYPENSDAYGDYKSLENSDAYEDNQYPKNTDSYGDNQYPENSEAYEDNQYPENTDSYGDNQYPENSEAYGDNQSPENSDAYGDYQSPENSDAYGDNQSLENSDLYGDNQYPGYTGDNRDNQYPDNTGAYLKKKYPFNIGAYGDNQYPGNTGAYGDYPYPIYIPL